MTEVTIGGEARRVGEFSAFKAFKAMELVSEIEGVWRKMLSAAAEFKRTYEAENVTTIDRAEARRMFGPRQAVETRPLERDGEIVVVDDEIVFERTPLFDEAGRPIMGPDPLGHLAEEDWAASDHKLNVPDSPPTRLLQAFMAQIAFKEARAQIMRLLALVLIPNSELERWQRDDETQIDRLLDEAGTALVHDAALDELLELGAVTVEVARDQLRDPFESIKTSIERLRRKQQATETAPPPEPMRVEAEPDSPDEANGSSSSPDASTGDPSTSGTASRSDSASSYAPA